MTAATHAYYARWTDCDCIAAVRVDEPDFPDDVDKDVGGYIRRGFRVERLPLGGDVPFRCPAHPKGTPSPWSKPKPVFGQVTR